MAKKTGSQRRDRQHLVHRANELYAVFHQETFNKEFRWYREVEEAEKEDMKNIVKVDSSNESVSTKDLSKSRYVFQSVDIRLKKK